MDLARVPAALTRRRRAWLVLKDAHSRGQHHPLLCSTPRSCDAYGKVLRAQLDLIERALRLPEHEQVQLAERLEQPGPAPLARLLCRAERRLARQSMSIGVGL